jgi:predicted DNA-binding transcriptional regulator YafY
LIKEINDYSIIEINSDKPKTVFRAVFDYGDEIEILSPSDSIQEYKENLNKILKLYNRVVAKFNIRLV